MLVPPLPSFDVAYHEWQKSDNPQHVCHQSGVNDIIHMSCVCKLWLYYLDDHQRLWLTIVMAHAQWIRYPPFTRLYIEQQHQRGINDKEIQSVIPFDTRLSSSFVPSLTLPSLRRRQLSIMKHMCPIKMMYLQWRLPYRRHEGGEIVMMLRGDGGVGKSGFAYRSALNIFAGIPQASPPPPTALSIV
jgi:hypothetical protein